MSFFKPEDIHDLEWSDGDFFNKCCERLNGKRDEALSEARKVFEAITSCCIACTECASCLAHEQINKACEAMDAEVQAGFELGAQWADENPPDLSVYYEELRGQLKQRGEMLAIAVEALKFAVKRYDTGCELHEVFLKSKEALAKIEELKELKK